MLRVMEFYIADFADGSLLEPGKLSVGQNQLFFSNQKPNAIKRNICYFNKGSAGSMRCVCHCCTP